MALRIPVGTVDCGLTAPDVESVNSSGAPGNTWVPTPSRRLWNPMDEIDALRTLGARCSATGAGGEAGRPRGARGPCRGPFRPPAVAARRPPGLQASSRRWRAGRPGPRRGIGQRPTPVGPRPYPAAAAALNHAADIAAAQPDVAGDGYRYTRSEGAYLSGVGGGPNTRTVCGRSCRSAARSGSSPTALDGSSRRGANRSGSAPPTERRGRRRAHRSARHCLLRHAVRSDAGGRRPGVATAWARQPLLPERRCPPNRRRDAAPPD